MADHMIRLALTLDALVFLAALILYLSPAPKRDRTDRRFWR